MGLAIVQRIIDWQGGKIWFEDVAGDNGVVFRFTWNKSPQDMPADDDSSDGEQAAEAAKAAHASDHGSDCDHDHAHADSHTHDHAEECVGHNTMVLEKEDA